jgi:hypothetical protein
MLFLGYSVERDGRRLSAIRNFSETRINDIFLQHVVAMTQSSYDRYVLGGLMQQGRRAPPEARSLADILQHMRQSPDAVTFMWKADAAALPELRILRVLWIE